MLSAPANSLTDPTTWPWDTLIWIVAPIVAAIVRPLLHWLRDRRAESWPSTVGRIEAVSVDKASGWASHLLGTKAQVAEIAYSYRVAGKPWTGRYRKYFRKAGDASEFVRDLRGMTVTVQYDPAKSSSSTLLNSSVDSLLVGRPPLHSLQIYSGPTKDAVAIGPKEILLILIAAVAFAVLLRR
ncbi:MAG TPA: DUF3592 domain-containing protein [Terriglobales bacterium]|nr:DUF3592 domain-containing protein [Terriglobales bacterium]